MQATVNPQLRWMALLSLTGYFLPAAVLGAQQVERYSLPDDEVAIYNLAGEVTLEPGTGGDVTVQVTRGGADAAKLKVMRGRRGGVEILRVVYPENRIRYSRMPAGSSTQLRMRDDGTFGGDHDEHDRKDSGNQVTIAAQGGGVDAHADLRVGIPQGRDVAIYLAAGKVSATRIDTSRTIEGKRGSDSARTLMALSQPA